MPKPRRRVTCNFIDGPWGGTNLRCVLRQVHSDYYLPKGYYVLQPPVEGDPNNRYYRWIEE